METIKEIRSVDTNKIGMLGWSRGGIMTYLALKMTDKIKAAIVGNSPTNLFDIVEERPEMENNVFAACIPNYWNNKENELMKRSALFWAEEFNKQSSLLILAGTKDKHVNVNHSNKMAQKLKSINYEYELVQLETDHFFSDKKPELDSILIHWFNKKLKQ